MRQAYDYWQDQPGISSGNACAKMHCITPLVFQPTCKTNVPLTVSMSILTTSPHSTLQLYIQCFALHRMGPRLHHHTGLLISPTSPLEVHSDTSIAFKPSAGSSPAGARKACSCSWGGRPPLYSTISTGWWFEGGLKTHPRIQKKHA